MIVSINIWLFGPMTIAYHSFKFTSSMFSFINAELTPLGRVISPYYKNFIDFMPMVMVGEWYTSLTHTIIITALNTILHMAKRENVYLLKVCWKSISAVKFICKFYHSLIVCIRQPKGLVFNAKYTYTYTGHIVLKN